jgi:hypothetical protein
VSACQCRQVYGWIIAQGIDGFQRHVTGSLDRPFVILLEQDRPNEPDYRVPVGEDADDVGAPLDLAVEALDRIGAVQFGTVLDGEGHVGEHVGFGLVKERGELGQLGEKLIGDPTSLSLGGVGVVLGEGGGDEGGDDAAAALFRHGRARSS